MGRLEFRAPPFLGEFMTLSEQQIFEHDPDAILDYSIDWSKWMTTGDTLSSATWSLPAGVTGTNDHISGSKAVIFIEVTADPPARKYNLTCHITTTAGREDDRTIQLVVTDR
jgi:hypothetical protein